RTDDVKPESKTDNKPKDKPARPTPIYKKPYAAQNAAFPQNTAPSAPIKPSANTAPSAPIKPSANTAPGDAIPTAQNYERGENGRRQQRPQKPQERRPRPRYDRPINAPELPANIAAIEDGGVAAEREQRPRRPKNFAPSSDNQNNQGERRPRPRFDRRRPSGERPGGSNNVKNQSDAGKNPPNADKA
ncbi:MAG: hypothetical protein WCQ72_02780, partial [Eubacteriales bacterium]